jgi:hypothetical protein
VLSAVVTASLHSCSSVLCFPKLRRFFLFFCGIGSVCPSEVENVVIMHAWSVIA